MASTETTTPAAPAPDIRKCSKCSERKTVSPETWRYRKNESGTYAAHGLICLACHKKAKAEYKDRTKRIAAKLGENETNEEKKKDIVAAAKMDVARALKAGGSVLNEHAPAVLARILGWFEDEDSPRHEWAVQFLAERILPRKLYEELGGQAAGAGTIGDRRPIVHITVSPAQASPIAPAGHVVDGQSSVVEVVSLPTERSPQ